MDAPAAIQIIFMGLVALVPKYDDNRTPWRNELTVLLPDAGRHGYSSDGCGLPRHIPFLAVEAPDCRMEPGGLQCPRWSPYLPLREPVIQGGGSIDGVWMLQRQQVELTFAPPLPFSAGFRLHHPELRIQTGWKMPGARFPKDDWEAGSSAWIGRSRVGETIRQDCLVGADCSITARMTLKEGLLKTCHFAQLTDGAERGGGGYPKVWPFRFGDLSWGNARAFLYSPFGGRAIADATSLEVPKLRWGTVLWITLRSLDRPQDERAMRLVYDGRPIRIWLANVADPDSVHDHGTCRSADFDTHFETYYDLSSDGDDDRLSFSNRRIPRRSGRAMYERECGLGDEGLVQCHAKKAADEWMEEFQDRCPLLLWGAPAGYGPQNGDLSICGQYQGKPKP